MIIARVLSLYFAGTWYPNNSSNTRYVSLGEPALLIFTVESAATKDGNSDHADMCLVNGGGTPVR